MEQHKFGCLQSRRLKGYHHGLTVMADFETGYFGGAVGNQAFI
jgi:hypothetical protein